MLNQLLGARALKFARCSLFIPLTVVMGSCDTKRQWHLQEITDHLPDLHFSLMSDSGQPVSDQTYQGYLVLLFFGFTRCQAECPITLLRLAKIVGHLGDHANRARILLVSLNPNYDTPPVLHRYVAAFDAKHAIGLTGSQAEIEELAKRYRIAYRPGIADSENPDTITHNAVVYVFDPQGHARLLIAPDDTIEVAVNDLLPLLKLLDSYKSSVK